MNEEPIIAVTNQPARCKSCSEIVIGNDQFCQSCGFPLKGTDEEQNNFIYTRNYKQLELQGLDRKIKGAGTTLYVLSGVFLLFGLIYFFMNASADSGSAILITNAVLAVIFLLLGFWSTKKPVAAIVSGLAYMCSYRQ